MIGLFALFGLVVGSFLNVLILRTGTDEGIGGRSRCTSCRTQLSWYENIPVVSWMFLRGKCRSCGVWISLQYPLVELLTALLFALIAASAMPVVPTILACAIVALAVAITVYDLHHCLIPDAWSYPLAIISFLYGLTAVHSSSELLTLIAAGPIAAFPLYGLWAFSEGRWMGFGDVKLALSIGWVLGPWLGIYAIFGAFVIGALISVCILLPLPHFITFAQRAGLFSLSAPHARFTMESEVPFGPFLVTSFIFVWFLTLYGIPIPLLP